MRANSLPLAGAFCQGCKDAARAVKRSFMTLKSMPLTAFQKIAVGIDRPEDVVVGADGRVFASDHQCAVAEIFPDGSFKRLGPPLGAPNGINMDARGRIIIAN